jgi:hypothetical protein
MAKATHNYDTGTWGYKSVAIDLEHGDVTVEEAARIIQQGGKDVRGFWNEQANRDCKAGRKMRDIDPALFPSSKGPRS